MRRVWEFELMSTQLSLERNIRLGEEKREKQWKLLPFFHCGHTDRVMGLGGFEANARAGRR